MPEFPFQEVATDPEKFRLFVVENLSILKTQMGTLSKLPDRVTILETRMTGLVGSDGNAGTVGELKTKVDGVRSDYQRSKGVLVGISLAVSTFISLIVKFFRG